MGFLVFIYLQVSLGVFLAGADASQKYKDWKSDSWFACIFVMAIWPLLLGYDYMYNIIKEDKTLKE